MRVRRPSIVPTASTSARTSISTGKSRTASTATWPRSPARRGLTASPRYGSRTPPRVEQPRCRQMEWPLAPRSRSGPGSAGPRRQSPRSARPHRVTSLRVTNSASSGTAQVPANGMAACSSIEIWTRIGWPQAAIAEIGAASPRHLATGHELRLEWNSPGAGKWNGRLLLDRDLDPDRLAPGGNRRFDDDPGAVGIEPTVGQLGHDPGPDQRAVPANDRGLPGTSSCCRVENQAGVLEPAKDDDR